MSSSKPTRYETRTYPPTESFDVVASCARDADIKLDTSTRAGLAGHLPYFGTKGGKLMIFALATSKACSGWREVTPDEALAYRLENTRGR